MYTVAQIARHLGVSGTTIRNYAAEFAAYLSASATPPPGEPRQFNDDDLSVLETIYILRTQLASAEDIISALESGQRLETTRPADDSGAEEAAPQTAAFTTALTVLETRLDKLENKLDEERAARLDAEIRAARLETELRILKESETADSQPDPASLSFTDWWRSRRRQG